LTKLNLLGFEAFLLCKRSCFQALLETLAQDENARRETGHFIFTNSSCGCEMIFSSFNQSLCL